MVTNDQSIEVLLEPQSANEIEQFVETICDQLFINDTYFGNILISVTTLFEELIRKPSNSHLKVTYHTDHQLVNIIFQPVDNQLIQSLEAVNEDFENSHKELDKLGFLLSTLVDKLEFGEPGSVTLGFDISALHNKVLKHRQSQLQAYFNHTIEEEVKKRDDQLQ